MDEEVISINRSFGDSATFAIECMLEQSHRGYPFGFVRVLVGEYAIGNYNSRTILSMVYIYMRDQLCNVANRSYESFESKVPEEIWMEFYDKAYDRGDKYTLEQLRIYGKKYRHYEVLTGCSEIFDAWSVILVEYPEYEMLIWKFSENVEFEKVPTHYVRLKKGTYYNVIAQFLQWLYPFTAFAGKGDEYLPPP